MTPQDMLDYALGQLEGPAVDRCNREMEGDPTLGHRCGCLRRSVQLLLDDGSIEMPEGLRSNTLAFIADHSSHGRRRILDFVPRSIPFRWTDVAVAAGILIAGLITLMPALNRGRAAINQAGCMFNLRQFGIGLGQYANTHQVYPAVEPEQYAICVAVKLKESGLLADTEILGCPCEGDCDGLMELDGCLAQIKNPRNSDAVLRVHCGYAYNVGYRVNGQPVPVCPRDSSMTPLVADKPTFDDRGSILSGNSPNHRGRGQNILFQDQSVRWVFGRRIHPEDADFYLNESRLPSYGHHSKDFSLVPGAVRVR